MTKCSRCSSQAVSFLNKPELLPGLRLFSGRSVCLKHLAEGLRRALGKYRHRVIIFPPYFNGQTLHIPYSYDYYSLSAACRNDPDGPALLRIRDNIKGACAQCSAPARAAFFPEESIEWKGEHAELGDIANLTPRMLCPACAGAALEEYLGTHEIDLSEGVDMPAHGDGYYMLRCW